MAEKYPIFYETISRDQKHGVEIYKIYKDGDLRTEMNTRREPKRVAFFDRATTMYNYFSPEPHRFDDTDKPTLTNKTSLFWYAYEHTHNGDIVLYEYQSDLFDDKIKDGLNLEELSEDFDNYEDKTIVTGKSFDVYYNGEAAAVSDMIKYGARLPQDI